MPAWRRRLRSTLLRNSWPSAASRPLASVTACSRISACSIASETAIGRIPSTACRRRSGMVRSVEQSISAVESNSLSVIRVPVATRSRSKYLISPGVICHGTAPSGSASVTVISSRASWGG